MSYSDVKEVAKDITKLALNGSPYWRVGVTAFVLALCYGWFWGYVNFARAEDINKLQENYVGIKEQLLAQSIQSAKKEQCASIEAGKSAAYWTEQLRKLKDEYFRLVGRSFEMPSNCNEL